MNTGTTERGARRRVSKEGDQSRWNTEAGQRTRQKRGGK